MARAREHPYIWATWLAKLLTGENSCEWAGWFRAHHQDWVRPPSDFDQSRWMLEHTALVNSERESHEKWGYTVYTENQNSFRLRGRTATLAGKPDLIAVNGHEAVIIDAKTGKHSPSHAAQVKIYQYAVPRALAQFRETRFRGHIVYADGKHAGVPESGVDREFVERLGALIRRLAADAPARRVPSAQECRFCDITKEDCPDRIQGGTGEEGTTEDF